MSLSLHLFITTSDVQGGRALSTSLPAGLSTLQFYEMLYLEEALRQTTLNNTGKPSNETDEISLFKRSFPETKHYFYKNAAKQLLQPQKKAMMLISEVYCRVNTNRYQAHVTLLSITWGLDMRQTIPSVFALQPFV